MTVVATAEENIALSRVDRRTTSLTALAALGIVYGDLGTSPLYTLQTVMAETGGPFASDTALGVLSLIFWSLLIVVSLKYCVFVMRADNHGEGGILALMSLLGKEDVNRGGVLVMVGLFGAALIYGDGIITPAISVLSALEGVNVANDSLRPYVMPLAVCILIALFTLQSRGSERIGRIFGPVMLVWFVTIGLLGIGGIVRHPAVLSAVNPLHAVQAVEHDGWRSFAVLGGVFLCVTGGEALYADMGHVGRNPIRTCWYAIVLPALLLNYAGQTALLMNAPAHGGNPFFMLAPSWARYPLVALATMATIIASQAIITGAFSLTRQATQLGWFPGLRIRQTSSEQYGQIYVPLVNAAMMIATIALTVGYGSSSRLAGAYGTAVSTTMLLTTVLLYAAMTRRWRWPVSVAAPVCGFFLIADLAFFSANLLKIREGGWIPLVLGATVFLVMTTWHKGLTALHRTLTGSIRSASDFMKMIEHAQVPRIDGTAVFLTRTRKEVPAQIVSYVEQTGALHDTVVALTVFFDDVPRVPPDQRIEVESMSEGLWRVSVRFGFVEIPDLSDVLKQANALGCPLDHDRCFYFGARDAVMRDEKQPSMSRWRLSLFAFIYRNAVHPVDVFSLPCERYVDIGRHIEL